MRLLAAQLMLLSAVGDYGEQSLRKKHQGHPYSRCSWPTAFFCVYFQFDRVKDPRKGSMWGKKRMTFTYQSFRLTVMSDSFLPQMSGPAGPWACLSPEVLELASHSSPRISQDKSELMVSTPPPPPGRPGGGQQAGPGLAAPPAA